MRFLLLALLFLPLSGCASALASQEDFTPKWSALAAAQSLNVAGPITPDTPLKPGICPNCNGKGEVGDGTIMLPCKVCGGDGRIEGDSGQCSNPLCKCENCKGKDCTCEPEKRQGEESNPTALPVKTGQAPAALQPLLPIRIVPIVHEDPTPLKKSASVSAGHWQSVQSCGRGGCSVQQVWVADAPQATVLPAQSACANGSCGVRRGLFGRRR